ncbi:pentapeptide repeat-containing protein [Streptomyces sp. NPDC060366]|uniref:pentapeptide repeat-containing protein n=1 Tax=Streptomyces sp. NPDC060366 TaxID=3347105 RepID=UPI003647893B
MTSNPRRPRGGLRLWPVGTVLALTFTAAMAVATAVFFAGWDLLGARSLKPERQLTSSTLFDLVKLAFGVVAGAGALVALVVAYRRQRVDEDGALRESTRLHTERFTSAVSQLGDESPAVRLGGVHALAGLADDAPTRELRQTCIDVLCAYVRLPYTAESDIPPNDTAARHSYMSLREVRHTVIRLIRDHLRLGTDRPHSWQGHDFDFTSAVFDGGDFSEAKFHRGTVDFSNASFVAGTVTFLFASFVGEGGGVFRNASFAGGTVTFAGASFNGTGFDEITIDFGGASFAGGTVDFNNASFKGGNINFRNASFEGSTVIFREAYFSHRTVDFWRTNFNSGTIDFSRARGAVPDGLVPPNGVSLPTGLTIPPAWRQTP